jgi:hypothetical protein
MNYKLKLILVALASLLALPLMPARADEFADKAREVYKKNASAIVTLSVVLNVNFGGQSRESKTEITAVVVDPNGLAVLPLSSVDPTSLMDSPNAKMEIQVSDIKIMMEDNTELPAEIVLRDKDLDLAFIRPKTKPAQPLAAIDLTKSGTAEVMDQVLTITRLGQAAGRAHAASVERIAAVVRKPRTFYIPDSGMTATRQGAPAFLPDGRVLGIFVFRAVNMKSATPGRDNVSSIILPAEDVLKNAKQAPEAKGDGGEKKDEAKEKKADADKENLYDYK